MTMLRLPLSALLVALLTPGLMALDVGDKAPALTSATWVKGAPVALGERVTVVEFWATWCGPCRTSIPHLTKLAAAHAKDLTVVGLSDEDAETVKPFVTAQADNMDYHVGLADEALKQGYMSAESGIPTAFLVSTDGTVLWKGHPMSLDRPLQAVLAGTWDQAKESQRSKRQAELQALLQEDPGQNEKALLTKILAKTAEILADDPTDQDAFSLRLGIARHLKDPKLAEATWAALPIDTLSAETAAEMTQRLLHGEDASPRLDLAWRLAQRAIAAEPDSANGLAALAAVQQSLGLLDAAIATQEKAVKADPEAQAAALRQYREARRLRDLVVAGKPVTAPEPAAESATSPAATLPTTAPAGIVP
jgi:thiol-disulfide isomerase/thioredoxin